MGGKFRPVVMGVCALALLAIASPVAVLTGPLAPHQVAAATGDAKHESKGGNDDAQNAPVARAPAGQPSERADHASASSEGRHVGAGDDRDEGGGNTSTTTASPSTASSGTPSAGTQAASTPAVVTTSTTHPVGTSTPPPVIVAPPAAPQTNPPIASQPALTGARLDWILVGVVVTLAAAVVAAVRVATFRGQRPSL